MSQYNMKSLYEMCIDSYVSKLTYKVADLDCADILRYLPPGTLIDIFASMADRENLRDMLLEQLSNLEIFARVIRHPPSRQKLFYCLTALMSNNRPLASSLKHGYVGRYLPTTKMTNYLKVLAKGKVCANEEQTDESFAAAITKLNGLTLADMDGAIYDHNIVDLGLRLGSFLSESGWITDSIHVLLCVTSIIKNHPEPDDITTIMLIDCLQKLLHSEVAMCHFKSAERTFNEISELVKRHKDILPNSLLVNVFIKFSAMYFARSEYDNSHTFSVLAMNHLTEATPERIIIDTLRHAAKACIVKRDYNHANLLISQATRRALYFYGNKHQKYADALLDLGFFLLNVDAAAQSVTVYKKALEIKRNIFGSRNYQVGIAHEDLSYAYYVQEYSTGNFTYSCEQVEKAVDIMKELVPSDHLMLASAKRVKALLLEEIALDKMNEGFREEDLLVQSEELHQFALQLSLEVFGEMNVQTAKHYGNLGRLYQTMNRFEEAEDMHLKAIRIKTALLGAFDYEVGLSIGHLASLYNYQMKKYREAENLYMRSIEISVRLFGESYSGLEYDYLGLCHVYDTLREFEKYLQYANVLEKWQTLRGEKMKEATLPSETEDIPLKDILNEFFAQKSIPEWPPK